MIENKNDLANSALEFLPSFIPDIPQFQSREHVLLSRFYFAVMLLPVLMYCPTTLTTFTPVLIAPFLEIHGVVVI